MIYYRITPVSLDRHVLRVTICFKNERLEKQALFMPNWTPGSYMIRDFSRHILRISAKCQNVSQEIQQIKKNVWQLPALIGDWEVEYDIYAFDLSPRGAFVDDKRAFFDGAAVWLAVVGRENENCNVEFSLPESWSVATSLREVSQNVFFTENYADLLDAPMSAGNLKILSFSVKDILHRVVLIDECDYLDDKRLCEDVGLICKKQIELFGCAPFDNYTFLLHVTFDGYGGLEHLSSSSLITSRKCLPSIRNCNNRDDYVNLLGLFSHEYFHAWNIKSIKPDVFQHYDLQEEVYTNQLWAFEGITSYYDDLMLLRSGVISLEEYLKLILKTIDNVSHQYGRKLQSVAQSSFNAWTKFYKSNENSHNSIISYYQKGALVALCLDDLLRSHSDDKYSLDDVMRGLYNSHQQVSDDDWQRVAEELVGGDLSDFFRQYVYGTQELPLIDVCKNRGIVLDFLSVDKPDLVDEFPSETHKLFFGATCEDCGFGKKIKKINYDSIADAAQLAVGDVIVAINGFGVSEFDYVWQQLRCSDTLEIHYLRNNRLGVTSLVVEDCKVFHAVFKIENRKLLCKRFGV
ncbi:MAG: M61 family metallopeptidase [Neisseriaceae bacterium]|nr:M61 family metallopeptidase [Neisseriaceae bacterium]